MYKLNKVIEYEYSRDLILKDLVTGQILTVFDDTDKFYFMKVNDTYDCKILLFARSQSEEKIYEKKAKKFQVMGKELIGKHQRIKIKDEKNNIFYISLDFSNEIDNKEIYLIPLRYDILQVNGIDRTY